MEPFGMVVPWWFPPLGVLGGTLGASPRTVFFCVRFLSTFGLIFERQNGQKSDKNRCQIFDHILTSLLIAFEPHFETLFHNFSYTSAEKYENGAHVNFDTPLKRFAVFQRRKGTKIGEKSFPGPPWNSSYFVIVFSGDVIRHEIKR